jgi:trk system potassium uptake protein TrkH
VDALFTATSASCVTGLVIVDTGSALSAFGQFIILVLIQVGGLGIMTFSTLFLDLLFEVVSAFGTVGLSTGVTGELSFAGKLIITLVMFVGRLGPLAVIVAISHRESASYYYAEENILIG